MEKQSQTEPKDIVQQIQQTSMYGGTFLDMSYMLRLGSRMPSQKEEVYRSDHTIACKAAARELGRIEKLEVCRLPDHYMPRLRQGHA